METSTPIPFEQLRAATKALSDKQRGVLLDDLVLALAGAHQEGDLAAVEAEWDAEIGRRASEVERGEAVGIPATEVRARLSERLPWLA